MKMLVNKPWLKHFLILIMAILLPLFFLSPVMQGKKLAQSDHISWEGMSKEIRDYKANTGEHSYWTNSMFSGMPSFFIRGRYPFHLSKAAVRGVNRSLPQPVGVISLMILCFYILGLASGVKGLYSLVGAVGFGFMSYSIVSLEAGHINKIAAVAFLPLVLAGLVYLTRKKYWVGAAVFSLGLALLIGTTHFQIIYYAILLCGVFVIYQGVRLIIQKEYLHLGKSAGIILLGIALGFGANFTSIYTSQVYTKETMRGGKSLLEEKDAKTETKNTSKSVRFFGFIPATVDTTKGLDKSYAQSWSFGPMETLTFILPSFRGGGSGRTYENTEFYKRAVQQGNNPQRINGAFYFGPQRFTSGPNYMGVVIMLFFVLGLILYKGADKWWVAGIFFLSLLLSWGKHFDFINNFFFYVVPMYNKFRAPSMILALPSLLSAYLAIRTLHQFVTEGISDSEWKKLWITVAAFAGVLVVFGMAGLGTDFTAKGGANNPMLADARKALLTQDAFRGLVLLLLTFGAMYLFKKGSLKETGFGLALLALVTIDFWTVNSRYFNDEDFVTNAQYERIFRPTQAMQQITRDTDPHFRVLNLSSNTFNDALTSYHVKSVGGYHAAKLIRYQDLIEQRLYGEMQQLGQFVSKAKSQKQLEQFMQNLPALNMLNTKYIIFSQNQFIGNSSAAGNAWFVDKVQLAETAEEEMAFPQRIRQVVTLPKKDSEIAEKLAGSGNPKGDIRLAEYTPNELSYVANNTSNSPQLAVFSEVYYKGSGNDWKATIDGDDANIYRVNYLLRGVLVPPGSHEITMRFEPQSVKVGTPITAVSSILLIMLLGGGLYMQFAKRKGKDTSA